MNGHARFAANPFSFSLETEVPISVYLDNFENYPNPNVSGRTWWKNPLSVQVINVDRKKNSFCLRVSNLRAPFMGAEAVGSLQQIGTTTIINGHIRNLAWKYLYSIPLLFTFPIFVISSMVIESLEFRILYLVLFIFFLIFNYIYMTLHYKNMLISALYKI